MRTVADLELNSPETALQLYTEFKNDADFPVLLERDGAFICLTVRKATERWGLSPNLSPVSPSLDIPPWLKHQRLQPPRRDGAHGCFTRR